ERPEAIGEIGARHRVEPLGLLRQRLDQARMAMPEARGRVRPHHVEVAATVLVPDMDSLGAHERNRQRPVVCGAVTRFEPAQPAHRSLSSPATAVTRVPINAAVRPPWSRCGLYSTISIARHRASRARSSHTSRNSRAWMPPGSGVPTPGASLGSNA